MYDKAIIHQTVLGTIETIAKGRGLFFLYCNELSCELLERKLVGAENDDVRAKIITYFMKRLEIEIITILQGTDEPRFFCKRQYQSRHKKKGTKYFALLLFRFTEKS